MAVKKYDSNALDQHSDQPLMNLCLGKIRCHRELAQKGMLKGKPTWANIVGQLLHDKVTCNEPTHMQRMIELMTRMHSEFEAEDSVSEY